MFICGRRSFSAICTFLIPKKHFENVSKNHGCLTILINSLFNTLQYLFCLFLFQFIYTYPFWDNVASEKRQLQKLLKMKMFSGLEQ